MILATDKRCVDEPCKASLLDWKPYRHQRVLRSTLAAEAASLDRAFDVGNFMAIVFSEMTYGSYKATSAVPIGDRRQKPLGRNSSFEHHSLSRRRGWRSMWRSLRQSCRSLRWVPTDHQRADALTKRNASLRDAFRRWAQAPTVVLTDVKSAEAGADNSTWRNPMLAKEKVNQCHCVRFSDQVKHLA